MEITQGALIPPGPRRDSGIHMCARAFSFSSSPQGQPTADRSYSHAATRNQHDERKNRIAGNPDNIDNIIRREPRTLLRIHDGQGVSDRLVQAGEILGCEKNRGKGIAHVDWGSGVEWRVSIRVVVACVGEGEGAGAVPLKDMAGLESILGNGGERPIGKGSVERITATLILRENKYAHDENDTVLVAEHVIGVVLFLGGDLDVS